MYEEAPKDAAERDARLRALPGGRRMWTNMVVIATLMVLGTIYFVIAAIRSGSTEPLGIAILLGFLAIIFVVLTFKARAARDSLEPSPVPRGVYLASVTVMVAALALFMVGVIANGLLAIAAYTLAAILSFGSYLVQRRVEPRNDT